MIDMTLQKAQLVVDGLNEQCDAGGGFIFAEVYYSTNIIHLEVGGLSVWNSEEDHDEELTVEFCWERFVSHVIDLTNYLASPWKPIEHADPLGTYILHFPKKNHGPTGKDVHMPMKLVGRPADYTSRKPTHYMEIPEDPV